MTATATLDKAAPAAYKALLQLSSDVAALATSARLDERAVELVKIRCSQLNGCAYCLRMHTRDAVSKGETADRLAVLAAWRDSGYFSPKERAMLAIAERTTMIAARSAVADDELEALTTEQIAAAQWITIVMNAFNRVAITSGYPVYP